MKVPAPQFGAFTAYLWMVSLVAVATAMDEKTIIDEFYVRTGGVNWIKKWDTNTPVCSREGITCDDDGTVADIVLNENGLTGAIYKDIWTLPSLRYFSATGNNIYDAGFEGFDTGTDSNPDRVQVIDLSYNIIENINGIGKAPYALRFLMLTGNKIAGPFPSELTNLQNIRKLYLNNNQISGQLPNEIGNFGALLELYMYGNKLTGTIPKQIGMLQKAEIITLAENQLHGTIPEEVNSLVNIHTFSAHNSITSGSLSGTIPSFNQSPGITELRLDGNSLTGTIPKDLFEIAKKNVDVVINLDDNNITGAVPSELSRFSDLDLGIVGNAITSFPLEFCSKDKWMNGLVLQYGCDAIACGVNTFGASGRHENALKNCTACPDKTNLPRVGGYQCELNEGVDSDDLDSEDYDPWVSKELTALTSFYMNSNPKKWIDHDGWDTLYSEGDDDAYYDVYIDDELGYCNFTGLDCTDEGRVMAIRLPYNGLSGEIHSSLLDLEKLEVLDLSYNEVYFAETNSGSNDTHGFHGLSKAKALKELRMSGTKTTNWKGISGAKDLRALYLDNLEFLEGDFPDEIYKLTNLQTLQAKSSSITGTLSTEIGKLTKLTSLNLYYNDLHSKLPNEMGLLSKLLTIELSENLFTGPIPVEFESLSYLTDISIHNRLRDSTGLNGKVPSFSQLPNLKYLNLDSNSLTGQIPNNLFEGVDDNNGQKRLYIGLAENELTGSVPTTLTKFNNVYLDVVGNKITEFDDEFENKTGWMDGEVTHGHKNAIMCPPKTFSHLGNSNSVTEVTCSNCAANVKYFGAMSCTSPDSGTPPVNPDRAPLIEFFYATNGKNWINNDGWDSSDSTVCDFHGIDCDNNNRVTIITLSNNGLLGEVPPSLWMLEKLHTVDLSGNKINVDFTSIVEAKQGLTALNLTSTRLADVDGIVNIPNLKELFLDDCRLITDISPLFLLKNLEKLSINNVNVNTQISKKIKDWQNLITISCAGCGLYGAIPSEIGELKNLKKINLKKNSLAGPLPIQLSDLNDLDELDLKENSFSGNLIDFQGNNVLVKLDLSMNSFTGPVPPNFLKGLRENNNIGDDESIFVDLSFNKLSGDFPDFFGADRKIFLDLGGNNIESLPGQCESYVKWMGGGLVGGVQGCDPILCPKGKYNDLGRYYKDDGKEYPCKQCDSGTGSEVYGSTKCTVRSSSELEALSLLYKTSNGKGWIKQRNWMTTAPICEWYGIRCERKYNMTNIVSIQLDNNNMKGDCDFSKVFDLTHLRRFDISGNDVRTLLNSVTLDFPNLEILGLSSTGIKNLNGIFHFKNLKELYIGDNALSGPLPNELFGLKKLEKLEISYNNFNDNLKKVGDLTNLQEFYASNNDFHGGIPYQFSSLQNLQKLDLSKNQLESTIPKKFSELTELRQLSLQSQKPGGISGNINNLKDLKYLERLELQNNKINGTIPDDFLQTSIRVDSPLWINLDYNELEGTVPENLQNLKKLYLYIVGNRLKDLPPSFCNHGADDWMGGDVLMYTCAAIGCPVGTYSSSGRASKGEKCVGCRSSTYFGSTYCSSIFTDERAILNALYLKTNGDYWSKNKNWNADSVDICDWEGITCEGNLGPENSGVTSINLEDFGLEGDIPSVIYDLPYLKELNLKKNRINISFEKIGNAINLETLNLSETGIDSIAGLSNAASLKTIHLTDNKISLELKDSGFFQLPNIENIFISWNDISGTIPSDIGKLSNLVSFYAYDNMIHGIIPAEIGNLKKLEEFVLSENQISGQLPNEIGELPSLELFAVYRYLKSGPKLSGILPPFDKSPSLKKLYLDYNNIGGTIPQNFLEQTNGGVEATASNNILTGGIPSELDNYENEEMIFEFEGNKIDSLLDPDFCNNARWMEGLVRNNGCDAILCRKGFANDDGRITTSNAKCKPCPNSQDGGAKYMGSQSCDIVNTEEYILRYFFRACNGVEWLNNSNWMSESTICDWYGIVCEDGHVTEINLEQNNLFGLPPKVLFQLRFLKKISLSMNTINFKFDGIEKARELRILHLGNIRISSLKGISNGNSLQVINLSENRFSGKFPEELLQIHNLKTLDLSKNQFTGYLPSFGDLNYLQKLNLAHNKFSGAVPSFAENWRISDLDISHNSFDKNIPNDFLDGTSVRKKLTINLSYNNIPGAIPTEMAKFEELDINISENEIIQLHVDTPCASEKFGCDSIACAPGTFNSKGRQESGDDPCRQCTILKQKDVFYGKIECVEKTSQGYELSQTSILGIMMTVTIFVLT